MRAQATRLLSARERPRVEENGWIRHSPCPLFAFAPQRYACDHSFVDVVMPKMGNQRKNSHYRPLYRCYSFCKTFAGTSFIAACLLVTAAHSFAHIMPVAKRTVNVVLQKEHIPRNILPKHHSSDVIILCISHSGNSHVWPQVRQQLARSPFRHFIVVGDPLQSAMMTIQKDVLIVRASDDYEHLPEKIYVAFKSVQRLKPPMIWKMDDDFVLSITGWTSFLKHVQAKGRKKRMPMHDYFGPKLVKAPAYSNWHFGHVPICSKWWNMHSMRNPAPYLNGGWSYFLSAKSLAVFALTNLSAREIGDNWIYEDAFVGELLATNGIVAEQRALMPSLVKSRQNLEGRNLMVLCLLTVWKSWSEKMMCFIQRGCWHPRALKANMGPFLRYLSRQSSKGCAT